MPTPFNNPNANPIPTPFNNPNPNPMPTPFNNPNKTPIPVTQNKQMTGVPIIGSPLKEGNAKKRDREQLAQALAKQV